MTERMSAALVQTLRTVRIGKALKASTVARRMGTTPENVYKFEKECAFQGRTPSIEHLARYAAAIGFDLRVRLEPLPPGKEIR